MLKNIFSRLFSEYTQKFELIPPCENHKIGSLPAMLSKHGFTYAGFTEEKDHMRGTQRHYFLSDRCVLIFGFAYSMYGEHGFFIGDAANSVKDIVGLNSALLSYYIPDYHNQVFNYLRDGDSEEIDPEKSIGDAIAASISERLETAIALFLIVRSEGRHLPLRRDWEKVGKLSLQKA